MRHYQMITALAVCTAVGGCSVFGGKATNGRGAELIDTSPGINVSRLDDPTGEADFQAAFQYVQGQDATTTMPRNGTASYTGGFGADATGDIAGFMTGAVNLTVDDFNTGAVSGTVDEMALYNADGTQNRTFAGAVFLNGAVSGTGLAANGTDNIRDNSTGLESDATLMFNGNFRNLEREGRASAITGITTGSGSGAFDYNLDNGKFYAVEQ
ncbi:MAG: hypothetical protein VX874_05010 [Pseudomonadota bacterium]|nr:hypothetical protein [Pseudomonadota bacterium]